MRSAEDHVCRRTFLGYDDAQQRIGGRHGFQEVVVVVDWKQVSVVIGVSQQQVHIRDVMDGLEEAVELLEASGAVPLQGKATVFSFELGTPTQTSARWFVSTQQTHNIRLNPGDPL